MTTFYSRIVSSTATEFRGVVGALDAAPKPWRATLTPPPSSLIRGTRLAPDNAANRNTYQLMLPAVLLAGAEFMHHVYWRLARDHGSMTP